MVRKIIEEVPGDVLREDLERYRQRALDLGATDAAVITSEDIVVDERVRAKCRYPVCELYGTNINCPPYLPSVEETRKLISRFGYGIFVKIDLPFEARDDLWQQANARNSEIVARIEAEAFYDGYYLATAFAGQGCKSTFCGDIDCTAMTDGQGCRHAMRARPNMHGVGMDVFRMATRQGWDVYPVGKSTAPSEVPHLSTFGLVLVH